jgi:hypothetical protein
MFETTLLKKLILEQGEIVLTTNVEILYSMIEQFLLSVVLSQQYGE